MSEELLKAIIQLFAIVARERITEDERSKIKDFLRLHLNREATNYYLKLFDEFCQVHNINTRQDLSTIYEESLVFLEFLFKFIYML
jgi:hypothetical protein